MARVPSPSSSIFDGDDIFTRPKSTEPKVLVTFQGKTGSKPSEKMGTTSGEVAQTQKVLGVFTDIMGEMAKVPVASILSPSDWCLSVYVAKYLHLLDKFPNATVTITGDDPNYMCGPKEDKQRNRNGGKSVVGTVSYFNSPNCASMPSSTQWPNMMKDREVKFLWRVFLHLIRKKRNPRHGTAWHGIKPKQRT